MKKAILSMIIAVLIAVSSLAVGAYTSAFDSSPDGVTATVVNSSGIYSVNAADDNVTVEQIAPVSRTVQLSVRYPVASVSVCGTFAVALCNDVANQQLVVYTYDLSNGVPDSFALRQRFADDQCAFYYSGSELFLRDENAATVINRFSSGGKLLGNYDFLRSDAVILCGYHDGFCVRCADKLYRYASGGYVALSGDTVGTPCTLIGDDILLDHRGCVYRVEGDRVTLLFTADTDGRCIGAVSDDGSVYMVCRKKIYRYDTATGKRLSYYNADFDIAALYCGGGFLYAASGSGRVEAASPDDFALCPDEQPPSPLLPISSDVYSIDSVNYRITRIPAGTTFAQFKANMHYADYRVQLYRGGKELKSGNVGTAMTVVFSADDTYTFELSVIGDITGEGNVNSRDVGELEDYFLGNLAFDGVYADAADLSADGVIDMLDLALLCRAAVA